MKKTVQILLILIFALTAFRYTAAQQRSEERLEQPADKIQSVSADFVQEKHLKILAAPMLSTGKFYYKAPGSLRWEYFSPVRSILLSHEGKTRRYIIKNRKIIEDQSAGVQSMQIVMDEIVMWLSGRFDRNPDFNLEKRDKKHIVLKPEKESFSRIIQRIEIRLSDRPGVIHSVMIHEGDDSYTRLEFKNVILNDALSDSLFKEIP